MRLRYISIGASAILVAMLLLGHGCGGGGELGPVSVATDVIVADIDGDTRADVLTLAMDTNRGSRQGRLVVYRQAEPGRFAEPVSYVIGVYPWRFTLGDIDGDGAKDLVVTDVDGRAVWLLWQEPTSGRFLAPLLLAGSVLSYQAAIADLNEDGAPDIAYTTDQIAVHYRDLTDSRTLAPPVVITVPGDPSELASGNLNADGLADLLMWTYLSRTVPSNGTIAMSLQSGGSLGTATTFAPQTGLNCSLLAIADFNGDSKNDMFAFFTPQTTAFSGKLTVLLQDPSTPGSFGAPVDVSLAGVQGIDGAAVADLNHDGRPDVAVVGLFPAGSSTVARSRLNLFVNAGGGALALAAAYDLPISASRVGAGDIDGDGSVDLVIFDGKQPMWMRQSTAAPGTFSAPQPLP